MAKKGKDKEPKDDAAEDEDKKPAAAEGEEGAEGAEGDGGKKSKKKLIIIGALAVVLVAGGGAGAYFAGLFGGGGQTEQVEKEKDKPVFYSMPEMIINLAAPGKNASFLKATIILELPNALDAVTVENNLPRLMDAFNTYVRELRPSDLSGSAGITRLREELLLRANKALEPTKINDVLFKEIVVQ
jgi:flagellar FliL protein